MNAPKFHQLYIALFLAIDQGEHDSMSVADVEQMLEDGSVGELLPAMLADYDTSIISEADWSAINAEWRSLASQNYAAKIPIQHKGICLLTAMAFECWQWHLREDKAA